MSVLLSMVAPTTAQSSQIFVDGQNVGPVDVPLGAVAVFDLSGPASQPFLWVIGLSSYNLNTPYGTLGVDPWASDSVWWFNGFNPSHFNYAVSNLPVTGTFTWFDVPFPTPPSGENFHTQAWVLDPTHPEGAVLTNTIEVVSVDGPPLIEGTQPNYGQAGSAILVTGQNFSPVGELTTVKVGDTVCPSLAGETSWVTALLPLDVESGPVTIETAGGTSGGNVHDVTSWCASITTPILEQNAPAVSVGRTTIIGGIAVQGERDQYQIHCEEGDELFCEVYAWDPNTQMITGSSNTANPFFDPTIRILSGPVPIAEDDDSGPQLNAGIGIFGGTVWFVADQTADYTVEIDTYLNLGFGNYILIMGTRSPGVQAIGVTSLQPNVARVGDTVNLYASGVNGGLPSEYTVWIGTTPVVPTAVQAGRIDFVVPTGANSEQVNITGPLGTSVHPTNRIQSWLSVINPAMYFAGTHTSPIQPGDTVHGTILTGTIPDDFTFDVIGGNLYSIEVTAFDNATGRAVTGGFLGPNPLDPDIRVTDPSTGAVLITEGNGGPGFNAWIGSPTSPAFVAPFTGTLALRVQAFFGVSTGSYIINIRDVTP
ncbi:MAG: hypothetical protein CL908_25255 [Deltaproteobacteria bacterium]|nr:hypothetical protein [Deltaproteobacteria bacterium]